MTDEVGRYRNPEPVRGKGCVVSLPEENVEVVKMNLKEQMVQWFETHNDEYLMFERVRAPRSSRPDLCGFMLLDLLVGGTESMISAAEHDVIYLSVDIDQLANAITEDHVITLLRCGVRYDEEYDCLAMFV